MSLLKKGSHGDSVTALQSDLCALGYDLSVDGIFGDDTEDAVRHLQKSFGYTVDGIVGDGTRFLLTQQIGLGWRSNAESNDPPMSKGGAVGAGSKSGAAGGVLMKKGDKSEPIRLLQKNLVSMGYTLEMNAEYGASTEAAIKHLQHSFGFPANGVLDAATSELVDQQLSLGWRGGN
jgi:peptidoglycan hydrolase-like protein with peptidoglycan-binding domain